MLAGMDRLTWPFVKVGVGEAGEAVGAHAGRGVEVVLLLLRRERRVGLAAQSSSRDQAVASVGSRLGSRLTNRPQGGDDGRFGDASAAGGVGEAGHAVGAHAGGVGQQPVSLATPTGGGSGRGRAAGGGHSRGVGRPAPARGCSQAQSRQQQGGQGHAPSPPDDPPADGFWPHFERSSGHLIV